MADEKPGQPQAPMSLRAYAAHRKALGLNGGSAPAVMKAINRGRLHLSIVRDAAGNAKIADAALADQEWTKNTDLSRAPGDVKERGSRQLSASSPQPPAPPPEPPRPSATTDAVESPKPKPPSEDPEIVASGLDPEAKWTLNDASAEEKKWKALKAELDYKEKLGELVPAADVEMEMSALFTVVRTKLLAVPVKARAQSPHWTLPDVDLVDRLIREALEELAQPDVDTPAPDAGSAA